MKISLWPKNTLRFAKNFGVFWIPVILVLMLPVGLGILIYFTNVHANHIRERFPIGKHVVIKGTGLEGSVASVSGCGCDIVVMVVDKEGHIQKVTADAKMLE